jgi:hypothetical protein
MYKPAIIHIGTFCYWQKSFLEVRVPRRASRELINLKTIGQTFDDLLTDRQGTLNRRSWTWLAAPSIKLTKQAMCLLKDLLEAEATAMISLKFDSKLLLPLTVYLDIQSTHCAFQGNPRMDLELVRMRFQKRCSAYSMQKG